MKVVFDRPLGHRDRKKLSKLILKNMSQKDFYRILKRFFFLLLPLSALVGGLALILYDRDIKTERVGVEVRETHNIELLKHIIAGDFISVVSDLMFLSEQSDLMEMVEKNDSKALDNLLENWLVFSERKGLYDQVRFLDHRGMEVVRINYDNGNPYTVPEGKLQQKGRRYYFRDTFILNKDEVYVSPFDLNIEKGKIEKPLKPMIRFATPVFDSSNSKKGVLVLNYLGAKLVKNFKQASTNSNGYIMLLNSEGYWLHGPNPEEEWGFMFKERADKRFKNKYKEAWSRISGQEAGQFHNESGMFTFTTIYPPLEVRKSASDSINALESSEKSMSTGSYYWKVVSYVSRNTLDSKANRFFYRFLQLYAIMFVILTIGSCLYAYAYVARKRAEQSELETERVFRTITATAADAIIIMDHNGKIIYWNQAAEEMFGYSFVEVKDKDLHPLIAPPRYHEAFHKRFRVFTMTGQGPSVGRVRELAALRKDGSEFPVEISFSSIPVNAKWHALGIVRDITERKLTDEALNRSNKLLDTIMNIQSKYILSSDPHRFFEELLNSLVSLTESEFGFIGEVLHARTGEPYLKTFAITNIAWNDETKELYENYKVKGFEFTNLKTLYGHVIATGEPVISNDPATDLRKGGLPEGHPPLRSFLGLPFYYGDRLTGMAGVANKSGGYDEGTLQFLQPLCITCGNIIEAHRANRLRIEAEKEIQKLSMAVEQSPVSIVVTDPNGVIEYVNPVFSKVSGYTFDEATGQTPAVLKSGLHSDAFYKELWETITSGMIWRGEFYNKKKSGDFYWESATISPVKDKDGVITNYIAVKEDITERMKAEQDAKDEFERFATIVNSLEAAVHVADIESYEVLFINEFLQSLTGDIVGKKCWQTIHTNQTGPCDFCTNDKIVDQAGQPGEVYKWEFLNPLTNRWYLNTDRAIKWIDGRIVRMGISLDITEQKRNEEEIREMNEELLDKSEFLEKFHKVTVGREFRMIELKKEVNSLLERLGEPAKYSLSEDEEEVKNA